MNRLPYLTPAWTSGALRVEPQGLVRKVGPGPPRFVRVAIMVDNESDAPKGPSSLWARCVRTFRGVSSWFRIQTDILPDRLDWLVSVVQPTLGLPLPTI